MEFQVARSWRKVMDVVRSAPNVAEGMAEIAAYCRMLHPLDDWDDVLSVDFAADLDSLQRWLEAVLHAELPSAEIGAFWFGLFDPCEDGETTRGLYVAGAKSYDPTHPDPDVFCGPPYWPEGRYAPRGILNTYYSLSKQMTEGAATEADYTLCLAYAGLALTELLGKLSRELLLGGRHERTVAWGYDSGDCNSLGYIRGNGFQRMQSQHEP